MTSIVSTSAGDVEHEAAAPDRLAEAAGVSHAFRDYLSVRIDVGQALAKLSRPLLSYYGEGAIKIKDAALLSVLVETDRADVPVSDTAASHAGVHPM
jgi:hypothetical protein